MPTEPSAYGDPFVIFCAVNACIALWMVGYSAGLIVLPRRSTRRARLSLIDL